MNRYNYSTQEDCNRLLSEMDSHFNYPSSSTKTTSTSEVTLISGSQYLVCVPSDYYDRLTEDEKARCKDSMPTSLTDPI